MEVTRALYECTKARSIKSSATLLHGSKIASILYTTLNWILKKTETNDVDNTQKCLLPTLILAYTNRMTTAVQGDCTKTFTVKLSQVITDAWKQGKTNYAKLVNALFENSCLQLISDEVFFMWQIGTQFVGVGCWLVCGVTSRFLNKFFDGMCISAMTDAMGSHAPVFSFCYILTKFFRSTESTS